MPSTELDEDAIDLQDLQAQIDLSMSFAQNLVTSWVKSTHFTQTSRQKALENELKEYMRRPARLGVGAPIPETQSLAREAARLKYKLEGGKKRQREDLGVEMKPQSEDEEESRAGAIKKKVRVDPFDVTSKRKKSTKVNGNTSPALHPAAMKAVSQTQPDTHLENAPDANQVAKESLNAPESSEVHKRKKKKHKSGASHDSVAQRQQEVASSPQAPVLAKVKPTVDGAQSPQIPASPKISISPIGLPTLPISPVQSSPASPTNTYPEVVDVSLTTTPLLSPSHRATHPDFLKQPLLNLDGSPSEAVNDENEGLCTPGPTPKKKRRRRKKKLQRNVEATPTER